MADVEIKSLFALGYYLNHFRSSAISDNRSFLTIGLFRSSTPRNFRPSITYFSDTFILFVITNEFIIIAFACLFILFLRAGLDNNNNQLDKMFSVNVLLVHHAFALLNIYYCDHLQENCAQITPKVWTTREIWSGRPSGPPFGPVDGLIITNDNEVLLIVIIINRLFATFF